MRLNRYKQLKAQINLKSHPNFVWCANPSCGQGKIHKEGSAVPVVTCEHCHARSCFTHQVPWHLGLTCEQYTASGKYKQENYASGEYIMKHTKRCPNPSCRRPIQKFDGCDHMICLRPGGCGHEFCWVCLADYGPIRRLGNHYHGFGCPYYFGYSGPDEMPILEVTRSPPDSRSVEAVAGVRCVHRVGPVVPERPPTPVPSEYRTTPITNCLTVTPVPVPRLFPTVHVPSPPTPISRLPQSPARPNVDLSPPYRLTPPALAPPAGAPVIRGPGPVPLAALQPSPVATRSSRHQIRQGFHPVKGKVSSFRKAQGVLPTISSTTWWSLSYLLVILAGLILRAG
ncbi:hypothetical protein OPQ81_004090 [Rhizoctonia solani]|nr:hypothetical protein OPQ81_004090 [Rhizoctonia solani]